MSGIRWLIVALCVVLVVLLVANARGERQRGTDVPVTAAVVQIV